MPAAKTERGLNLSAFLLNHHYAVAREEILSQVGNYWDDWNSGDERRTGWQTPTDARAKQGCPRIGFARRGQALLP